MTAVEPIAQVSRPAVVVVMMFVPAPEGFLRPMLTAMMSKAVPQDAQGKFQGGIAAVMTGATLAGTIFYAQVFGHFNGPFAPFQSPEIGFFLAAAGLAGTLALFLRLVRPPVLP